jgi:hypothetical protein
MFSDRVPTFFSTRCEKHRVENVWLEVSQHNASYVRGLNDVDHADLDETSVYLKRYKNEVCLSLYLNAK